ncbi:MAG TPA: benzoate/H(+) symporter BenE family transporter [Galbitalea sp.]|nr:benzoate/H(+) symporter BenE family transporter [Galbitalea sp.]
MVAGLVGALTGFASTFVLVLAGLHTVGATPAEAASGLLTLCIFQAVLAIVLSLRYRMPLSFAWSSPGAALLIAAHATTHSFAAAVGAFMVCGALTVITGLWPTLTRAITRIPTPIASAMLAGILFPICLAPIEASVKLPLLALPIVVVWLVLYGLAPRWAVPGALVMTIVVVGIHAGTGWLHSSLVVPQVQLVPPSFQPLVIVSLGVPLFLVTMAGQNVPGFAVLKTFGYEDAPARPILVSSGALSVVGALFGAHVLNLAALTAAIMAGPDAHPDRSKRWVASVTAGAVYILLGLAAGLASSLVAATPPLLITTIAGLAMLGALVSAIAASLEQPENRIVAILTFLVVASGIVIVGVGSAFWGLLVGGIVMLWLAWHRRRRDRKDVTSTS